MAKKYKHWNDGKHKKLEEAFETWKMADEIHRDFIRFLLNDFEPVDLSNTEKTYVHDRFNKAIGIIEDITYILRDANAIRAMYATDYEQRRIRFERARGYCFQLMGLLDNIAIFVPHIKNKQKYVDTSGRLMEVAGKIQNLIRSDDRRRKRECKPYEGND